MESERVDMPDRRKHTTNAASPAMSASVRPERVASNRSQASASIAGAHASPGPAGFRPPANDADVANRVVRSQSPSDPLAVDHSSRLSKIQRSATASAPIQRSDEPLVPRIQRRVGAIRQTPPMIRRTISVSGTEVGKNDARVRKKMPQQGWATDKVPREFENDDELATRATEEYSRAPTNSGQIWDGRAWFRLPMVGEGFFVLGENHGFLNYRELLQACNRGDDKFLGEGGSIPIDSLAGGVRPEQKAPEGQNDRKELENEYAMESILSKALFPIAELQSQAGTTTKTKKTVAKSKAGPQIKKCLSAINAIVEAGGSRPELKLQAVKDALEPLGKATTWGEVRVLVGPAIDALTSAIAVEVASAGLNAPTFAALQHGQINRNGNNPESPEVLNARSQREQFMYAAIVAARHQGGYTMAGIGDNHLLNLRPALEEAGIATISHEEFKAQHLWPRG